MAYLPPEQAVVGTELAVEYMNERYPVTVAVAGSTPIFDPENARIRVVKILVCVKRVPMTGGTDRAHADEQAIETRHLGFTISPHEECGVEEAVRLVEANGGESVVLTLGPAEAEEQLRDAMALGIDRAILLLADEEWDGAGDRRGRSSRRSRPSGRPGPFDLIFFGNESADSGDFQVGLRVAHALGRPCATGLKGVAVADGEVRCEQEVAGGRDVYALPLPAVVTVLEGLNLPRYPSVPGRMRAKRKPLETRTPVRAASRLEKVRLVVPEGQGKQAEVLGDGADAAPAVVEMLRGGGRVSVLVLFEHADGAPTTCRCRR